MTVSFCKAPGEITAHHKLRVPKAQSLARALAEGLIAFSALVESRLVEGADVVVFDVAVEVPQLCTYPICPQERIAAIFFESDDRVPEVLALRADFPWVPHLNLRDEEFPRSLCLYEEQYRDLKRRWTAPGFVERIRQWLALTAKGNLHQEDQPLEPLLIGYAGQIVLPHDLLDPKVENFPEKLYVTAKGSPEGLLFLTAQRNKPPTGPSIAIAASVHRCPPQQHGLIHRRPRSLAEIAAITEKAGLDLLADLRARLQSWREANKEKDDFTNSHLTLVVTFPKARKKGASPESTDVWAFITKETVKETGEKLGLWEERDGHLCPLILSDTEKKGQDVSIDVLNPSFELTRKMAANLNGQTRPGDDTIAAVGVGALGSQVVMNLARSGFGKWTLIDDDRLMPHNISRHALTGTHIGWEKVACVAFEANSMVKDEDLFTALPADVIYPGNRADEVNKVLKESDIILDMSASVTVARHLALDIDSPTRRVSLFLTPAGDDLVLLAEDNARLTKLDELEMQYYRAILEKDGLRGHFKPSEGRRRYGQSCRDITSTLPQDLVALHSAIGGRAFREVVTTGDATIAVWRSDPLGNVRRIDVVPAPVIRYQIGNWTVCTDENLLRKLSQSRLEKLPNETGGALLGSFDLERNIVYIVDFVPSPPDSEEWPTLYIRGCRGLRRKIDEISQQTDGMLEYIGEWHSHPTGAYTAPSKDDLQVFSWLTSLMNCDGLPALMMIVGGEGQTSCFVGQMKSAESLLPFRVTT